MMDGRGSGITTESFLNGSHLLFESTVSRGNDDPVVLWLINVIFSRRNSTILSVCSTESSVKELVESAPAVSVVLEKMELVSFKLRIVQRIRIIEYFVPRFVALELFE